MLEPNNRLTLMMRLGDGIFLILFKQIHGILSNFLTVLDRVTYVFAVIAEQRLFFIFYFNKKKMYPSLSTSKLLNIGCDKSKSISMRA